MDLTYRYLLDQSRSIINSHLIRYRSLLNLETLQSLIVYSSIETRPKLVFTKKSIFLLYIFCEILQNRPRLMQANVMLSNKLKKMRLATKLSKAKYSPT